MYLLLEDFKFGLDTRKFFLNSPAGTLTTLSNGHITPGGEIEKRKAFTRQYLPANCYGLVPTTAGLTVFGSVRQADLTAPSAATTTHRARTSNVATLTFASHSFAVGDTINISGLGGTGYNASGKTITAVTATTITFASTGSNEATAADTGGSVVLNYTLPTGVVYQRLRHPVDIGAADATETYALTELVHASVYDGAAFAIAKFGSYGTFAYYDGTIVYDFYAGKATSWLNTTQGLANHLAALINDSSSFSSSSATLVGSDYRITVTAPAGVSSEITKEVDTAGNGDVTVATAVTQVDGINGVSASGQFSIVAGAASAGVNKVSSVTVASQELLGAAVDWATSNEVTAAAVKDAINARQSSAPTVTDRSRTSNVATLTIGAHKFIVGDIVVVAGVTNAVSGDYNGTQTITAVGGTTISYANTGTNEAAPGAGPGTVTMSVRRYTASVFRNVVELDVTATGDTLNDSVVSVTTGGDVCVDNYSFAITQVSGAGTGTPGVPTVDVFINGVTVTGGAVAAAANLETMAANVAAAVTGYAAVAVGNKVYLSRNTTNSSSNPLSVMVVVNANGGVSTGGNSTIILSPGPTNLTQFGPSGSYPSGADTFIGSTSLYVSVAGGTPPYSYLWSIPDEASLSAANQQLFTAGLTGSTLCKVEFLTNDSAPMPQLQFTRWANATSNTREIFPGVVRVKVTDSVGRVATADLPLTAAFYNYNTA